MRKHNTGATAIPYGQLPAEVAGVLSVDWPRFAEDAARASNSMHEVANAASVAELYADTINTSAQIVDEAVRRHQKCALQKRKRKPVSRPAVTNVAASKIHRVKKQSEPEMEF